MDYYNGKFALVITLLLGISSLASGAINVTAEINRAEQQIKNFRPPPELIGNLLHQLQTQCRKNRTINEAMLNNASKCVEQYMNETQVFADIKKAVPEGQLDHVFRDMCLKWPKVKGCLSEFFDIISDCWERGGKVNKAVEEAVAFFCGEENDGGRIALFLAEGGMECLEKHGDKVKVCVEKIQEVPQIDELPDGNLDLDNIKIPEINKDEICEKLEQLKACSTKELKKCKDTTPENMVTSMIRSVGRAVECTLKDDTVIVKTSGASSFSDHKVLLSWLMTAVAGGLLL